VNFFRENFGIFGIFVKISGFFFKTSLKLSQNEVWNISGHGSDIGWKNNMYSDSGQSGARDFGILFGIFGISRFSGFFSRITYDILGGSQATQNTSKYHRNVLGTSKGWNRMLWDFLNIREVPGLGYVLEKIPKIFAKIPKIPKFSRKKYIDLEKKNSREYDPISETYPKMSF